MKNNKKVGIIGGTFNPIHNGHIKMADFVLKNYKFDKILFVPAYLPPHKEVQSNLAGHRLAMVKLATKTNPKFEVSDIDLAIETAPYYGISKKEASIIATDICKTVDSEWERNAVGNGLSRAAINNMRPAFSACSWLNK